MYRLSRPLLLTALVTLVLACGLTSVVVEEPTAPTETRMPRTATPIEASLRRPTQSPVKPARAEASTPKGLTASMRTASSARRYERGFRPRSVSFRMG